MGYNTDFEGSFEFDEELDLETFNRLKALNENDHREGNTPGIWCQWASEDGKSLKWDGNEKFYNYVEWLQYIIDNIVKPKGYVLNGSVEWTGEERGDYGLIEVKDNVVTTKEGHVCYN